MSTRLGAFDATGKHLHMRSSIAQDKSALMRIDWSTGDESVLFGSERGDISDAMFDARTFEPVAVCIDPGGRNGRR